MKELPAHGHLNCRDCFQTSEAVITPHPKWKLRNDPGAWGSTNPCIMVVGFSKGATQSNIYATGTFDDVAFGGEQTRKNLTNILRKVNLLTDSEISDDKIKATEQQFSFSSLVRCSCARFDEEASEKKKEDVYKTSGKLIVKSFTEIPDIIDKCTKKYLSNLPNSVKLVCFLGVTDSYIKKCKKVMRSLYPSGFDEIDAVTYKTQSFLCVHLTHPSKGNGTIDAWLNTDLTDSKASNRKKASARKREMAIKSIERHELASTI